MLRVAFEGGRADWLAVSIEAFDVTVGIDHS